MADHDVVNAYLDELWENYGMRGKRPRSRKWMYAAQELYNRHLELAADEIVLVTEMEKMRFHNAWEWMIMKERDCSILEAHAIRKLGKGPEPQAPCISKQVRNFHESEGVR